MQDLRNVVDFLISSSQSSDVRHDLSFEEFLGTCPVIGYDEKNVCKMSRKLRTCGSCVSYVPWCFGTRLTLCSPQAFLGDV